MRIEYVGGTRKKLKSGSWATAAALGGGVTTLPPRVIEGLHVYHSASDLIRIEPGVARDDANTADLIFQATALTKLLTATFTAGDGGGMLASGQSVSADEWGHVYMIGSTVTPSDVDFILTTTASGVTGYPSDGTWTVARRIGSVYMEHDNKQKHLIPYGDYVVNGVPTGEFASKGLVRPSDHGATIAINVFVPPGVNKVAAINVMKVATGQAAPGVTWAGGVRGSTFVTGTPEYRAGGFFVQTRTIGTSTDDPYILVPMGPGQGLQYRSTYVTGYLQLHVLGWYDTRVP